MSFASLLIRYAILGILISIAGLILYYGAVHDSAIMDELAHIPAGYGYVKYLDYRLNPEHPPLLKALAALPLLWLDLKFPLDNPSWQSDINGQWAAGAQFLYEYGNDAHKIISLARLAPIFITLLLILAVYILSAQLLGSWWAFIPTLLVAFSPSFLAHGHYVTTDVGAAFGFFIAIWSFVALLYKPSTRRLLVAGLCFGIAQLLKFSAVLLIPCFFILMLIFYTAELRRNLWHISPLVRLMHFARRGFVYFMYTVGVLFLGMLLVYGTYFLFTRGYPKEKQFLDTVFILESYGGGPTPAGETCRPLRCPADLTILMTKSEALRPIAEYLLGVLMVAQRSAAGNTGYFLGEVSAAGWWYYFPVVYILKETLAALIFVALGTFLGIYNAIRAITKRSWKISEYLAINFYEFAMLFVVLIYWALSIRSPLNIGVRHILPTLPFIYILSTSAVKRWILSKTSTTILKPPSSLLSFIQEILKSLRSFFAFSAKSLLLTLLMVLFIFEVAAAWPYYLSYFNQLGGGTQNGYLLAVDSNYDWGQDLYRLRDWVQEHHIKKIAIDYFGGGNPRYELGEVFVPWWSAKNNPLEEDIEWLAVSVNTLQGALGATAPGFIRKPEDEYRWLVSAYNPYKPYARAGTSIFIYKLK